MIKKAKFCYELHFPPSLRKIGKERFQGGNMAEIEFNEGLKEIDASAFERCRHLDVVRFPKSLEVIGGAAFKNCIGIIRFDLQDGIKKVGPSAFDVNSDIAFFSIPSKEFECDSMFGTMGIDRSSEDNFFTYVGDLVVKGDKVPRCVLEQLIYNNYGGDNNLWDKSEHVKSGTEKAFACQRIAVIVDDEYKVITVNGNIDKTLQDIEKMEEEFKKALEEKKCMNR